MDWVFLTNHAAVLFYVSEHPDSTVREMVATLGLGRRTVLRITPSSNISPWSGS